MSERTASELPAFFRRGLGAPVLFLLVQAFLAAGLYFSLGVVSERALGWTWIVYAAAAAFFVLTVLSYVEGASLHQERGGATVIARHAFNELWSFVAGWAILLDYVILAALTAFVATDYLGVFWGRLESGAVEWLAAAVLLGAIALANVRGLDPRRFERIAWLTLGDLLVQLTLVVVGFALLFEPQVLSAPSEIAGRPTFPDLAFAFTLAVVAFTGLDASSGFAGQVAVGRRGLRRLVTARAVGVLLPYVALTLVAASTLGVSGGLGSDDVDSPLLGVAGAFSDEWLRESLSRVVAVSACVVLGIACMAAMLGLSRLGYSLALNRQIPSTVGRLHPTYATPHVIIAIATVLALGLMLPGDVELLSGLYAFGATIAFTLVHVGVCVLRVREPDRDRPFRIPFNVGIRGAVLPVSALLGAAVSVLSFLAVLWLHEPARILGSIWMGAGLTMYVVYRRSQGKPVFQRVTVPERTLTRTGQPAAAYGSILVPVLGTPLDDDIMQTAGRLAAEERADEEEKGAQIEAMWVFEVPMSLSIDARLPEAELKRAREALKRAKAVGEEYDGVEVSTFTVRARKAGEAITREAARRGVEAIVMPAEEPSSIRGGVLLGGKQGLRDSFVGEITRHVLNKAPCRVILTAPPDAEALRRRLAEPGAPPATGDPTWPMRRAAERLRRATEAAARDAADRRRRRAGDRPAREPRRRRDAE